MKKLSDWDTMDAIPPERKREFDNHLVVGKVLTILILGFVSLFGAFVTRMFGESALAGNLAFGALLVFIWRIGAQLSWLLFSKGITWMMEATRDLLKASSNEKAPEINS